MQLAHQAGQPPPVLTQPPPPPPPVPPPPPPWTVTLKHCSPASWQSVQVGFELPVSTQMVDPVSSWPAPAQ